MLFFLFCFIQKVSYVIYFFFFQAEDGIRDHCVTGVQTCALPISAQGRERGPITPASVEERRARLVRQRRGARASEAEHDGVACGRGSAPWTRPCAGPLGAPRSLPSGGTGEIGRAHV